MIAHLSASSSAPVRTAKPPGERPVTLTLRRVVPAPRPAVAALLLAEWHAWPWLTAHSRAPMHVLPPAADTVPRTECGHVAAGATRVVVRHTAGIRHTPLGQSAIIATHAHRPHHCSALSVVQQPAHALLTSWTASAPAAWAGGTPSMAAAAAPRLYRHGMLTLQRLLLPSCPGATR